jgi:hypothetical protein
VPAFSKDKTSNYFFNLVFFVLPGRTKIEGLRPGIMGPTGDGGFGHIIVRLLDQFEIITLPVGMLLVSAGENILQVIVERSFRNAYDRILVYFTVHCVEESHIMYEYDKRTRCKVYLVPEYYQYVHIR